MNWVDACKGKVEASCPFECAARLTEVMLLGIVALRAGKKIDYDGANMRITNALPPTTICAAITAKAGRPKMSSRSRPDSGGSMAG